VFDPGFSPQGGPQGRLESPSAGDTQKGVITGHGVVYDVDGEMGIRRVDVLVDGIASTRAVLRVVRPDVCATETLNGCPGVGFTFTLNPTLQGISPGEHSIQLRATNGRGVIHTFPETPVTFRFEATEIAPTGRIEAPAPGAEVSGNTTVRGYAFAPDVRIARVDILVDGVLFGRASYGDVRNDVCGGLSPAPLNCPRVGFTFTLNTTRLDLPLSNGRHSIAIRVQDEAGRSVVLPETTSVEINNPEVKRPVGVLVSPRQNETLGGTIKVSGYAYSPEGRITAVLLVIDAFAYAAIPYGSPRPEECQAMGDPRGCPNVGFEMEFDTKRLSNGPHSIQIGVRDDRGRTEFFPATNYFGVNVIVANQP
jgi:hypothetical protein